MKIVDILNVNAVIQEVQDVALPMRTSYKIAKFLKEAQQEIEFFQTKYREVLAVYRDKEGVIILENGDVQMPPEIVADFNKEINELTEIETGVQLKFTEIELEKCNLKIPQMMTLMPFIEG